MGATSCRKGGGAGSRPRRAPPLFGKQRIPFRRLLATGGWPRRAGAQGGETLRDPPPGPGRLRGVPRKDEQTSLGSGTGKGKPKRVSKFLCETLGPRQGSWRAALPPDLCSTSRAVGSAGPGEAGPPRDLQPRRLPSSRPPAGPSSVIHLSARPSILLPATDPSTVYLPVHAEPIFSENPLYVF